MDTRQDKLLVTMEGEISAPTLPSFDLKWKITKNIFSWGMHCFLYSYVFFPCVFPPANSLFRSGIFDWSPYSLQKESRLPTYCPFPGIFFFICFFILWLNCQLSWAATIKWSFCRDLSNASFIRRKEIMPLEIEVSFICPALKKCPKPSYFPKQL